MKLILTKWKQNIGAFGFEDNQLVEANIFDSMQEICVGDIYLGRVNKVLPNINAYFVKIGVTEIFLPFSETDKTYKSGDNILIQIKKESSKGKQPLGTTCLSLAGMYCVISNEPYSVEVSSKLDFAQRKYWKEELEQFLDSGKISEEDKELLSKYCVIIRTNVTECENVSDITPEWLSLARKLNYILEKGIYQNIYTKLYTEKQGYISYLKNVSHDSLEEIVTDDINVYEELNNFFEEQSDMRSKLRLYTDEFSLLKLYSLESKVQEALNKKVWLKCGGFLMIEPTEALTVIDVNSGKFEKKGDSENYYKKVNEEAAEMIARQIKLRNISGIIIVDFINMQSEKNQKDLLKLLSEYVSKDKVKTCVIGMTPLGLVEITRKKIEKPIWEQI